MPLVSSLIARAAGLRLKSFAANAAANVLDRIATPPANNVVPLHPAPGAPTSSNRTDLSAVPLQDNPLLAPLFAEDCVERGYNETLQWPDHETLEHGTGRIKARFGAAVGRVIQGHMALLDEAALRMQAAGQQGTPALKERLRLMSDNWRRDIETLKLQLQLARDGEGWVEPLLIDYRVGHERAMRETLDMQPWLR